MGEWSKLAKRLEDSLRLRTFPVAVKLFENVEEMEKIEKLKKLDFKPTLFQMIALARVYGWTMGATAEDFIAPNCAAIIGLCELPEISSKGTLYLGLWHEKEEDAQKKGESIVTIPAGKYKAVAIGPLSRERFEPDIVIIYGNPAQMQRIINGLQWEDYEPFQFFHVGETGCGDSIARCYITKKPSLSIPCYGERRYGYAMDDELNIAIPPEMIEKLIRGMDGLQRSGIRYPIACFGMEADQSPGIMAITTYGHD